MVGGPEWAYGRKIPRLCSSMVSLVATGVAGGGKFFASERKHVTTPSVTLIISCWEMSWVQKHVYGSDATGHLNMRHLHSSENAQQPLIVFFGDATVSTILKPRMMQSIASWRIVAMNERNHT